MFKCFQSICGKKQPPPSTEGESFADMEGAIKKNRTHLVMFILILLMSVAFIAVIMVREYGKIKTVETFIKSMEVDVGTEVLSERGLDPRYLTMKRDRETILITLSSDRPTEMPARKIKELLNDYFTVAQIPEEYGLVEVLLIDESLEEGEAGRELIIHDYRLDGSKEVPTEAR